MSCHQVFTQDEEWQKLLEGIKQLSKEQVLTRYQKVTAKTKFDGSVITEADTQMQHHTEIFLNKNWPQFGFLGEESKPEEIEQQIKHEQGCWILDPVDGTNNFVNNIPFFSTSLALMVNGTIVAGLVYDISRDEMFSARTKLGARLNDIPLISKTDKLELNQCTSIIDFKRLPSKMASSLASKPPYGSQRSFGSVALDWCWIAAGRGQVYCHGSQNIWDYAAGWLILKEAGGYCISFEGEEVLVQRIDKRSAICATTLCLFEKWQKHLKQLL